MKNIILLFFTTFLITSCKTTYEKDYAKKLEEDIYVKIPIDGVLTPEASFFRFKDSIYSVLSILDESLIIESFENYSTLIEIFHSSFKTREQVSFKGILSNVFNRKGLEIKIKNGYEKGSLVNIINLFEDKDLKEAVERHMQDNQKKIYRLNIIMEVKIKLTNSNSFRGLKKTDIIYIKFPGQLEIPSNFKQI